MIRWQNYREAHNIHGDEQVSFDKRKQNQGADAKKYGPQKEKVHQNQTNTKQTNAKPNTYNNSQSSGAGGAKIWMFCMWQFESQDLFMPTVIKPTGPE